MQSRAARAPLLRTNVIRSLNLSIVGINGKVIYDGVKSLVLGVVWQLMRAYTVMVLHQISGSEGQVSDAQIVEFVNKTVCQHPNITCI